MDIVEELLADELPDDRQSDREARIILCDMHRRAADEIEWLREALRIICDGPRDVEKSYAELFAEVKTEARNGLQQKESE